MQEERNKDIEKTYKEHNEADKMGFSKRLNTFAGFFFLENFLEKF